MLNAKKYMVFCCKEIGAISCVVSLFDEFTYFWFRNLSLYSFQNASFLTHYIFCIGSHWGGELVNSVGVDWCVQKASTLSL